MRKNRSNNGYIGKDRFTPYDGSMAPSNIHRPWSTQTTAVILNDYTMPTDGGGYGATASVTLTDGTLLNAYITDYTMGGTGYVANTNLFKVSGGGGPTAWGVVDSVTNATVNSMLLRRGVDSIVVTDPGSGYDFAPTLTFGSGVANSSITASISGNTLDVTAISSGTVLPRSLLSGTGVAENTIIADFGTGRGGTGTYTINNSQTLSSRSMTTSTTATAVATVADGRLTGISMTYAGLYAAVPVISYSGILARSPASAHAVMEKFTGYSSTPTVTFINPSSGSGSTAFGATASPLLVYDIASIGVSAGGQDYTSSPSVLIRGAENSTTTATASVSGGTISAITAVTGGVVFASVPEVIIGGWKDLPSVTAGEDKFVGTYAIYDGDNYVAFTAGRTYDVDWGDGTTGTFNTNATASKVYGSSVFQGITQNAVDGYKTVVITITPVSGGRLTTLNFNVRHASLPSNALFSTQWLNMKMAGNTLSGVAVTGVSKNIRHNYLESFEFVGSPGNLTTTTYLFDGLSSLKRFEGSELTANSTSTAFMFQNCSSLRYVSDLNTSKVTTMIGMFSGCRVLGKAPKMDTRLVTSMGSMFNNCNNLVEVPFYDTRSNTTMQSMFVGCVRLKQVPKFDTQKVNNFASTFSACRSLLSVPHFYTAKATAMNAMFSFCRSLKTIPEFDTSSCTNMTSMFSGCTSLTSVPLLNTSLVTSTSFMFDNCDALQSIPQFNTSRVTNMQAMFQSSGIKEIPVLDMREVTNTSAMFGDSQIVKVPQLIMPKNTNPGSMFLRCYNLREVGNLYMPEATFLQQIFDGCSSLEYPPEIVVKAYQRTSSPTNITHFNMFNACSALKRLPLFTTTVQTIGTALNYGSMFANCALISEVPEYDFLGATGSSNTSSLSSTFTGMHALTRIKARNFCQSFTLPNPNMMGATALNELYTNLAVVGAGGAGAKTLTVTGSLGVAGDNPGIATAKGWTITG